MNLTFSCSLKASEISTIKLVSVARSTLAVRSLQQEEVEYVKESGNAGYEFRYLRLGLLIFLSRNALLATVLKK